METLGKSRHKWKNIKIDHREMGWEGKVCTGFIWLNVVCSFSHNKPLGSINRWEILVLDSQLHRAS
jgi:hypothetical protein